MLLCSFSVNLCILLCLILAYLSVTWSKFRIVILICSGILVPTFEYMLAVVIIIRLWYEQQEQFVWVLAQILTCSSMINNVYYYYNIKNTINRQWIYCMYLQIDFMNNQYHACLIYGIIDSNPFSFNLSWAVWCWRLY